MLYTLLADCLISHLNNTPTPGSLQEPGAVFLSGLPLSETARAGEEDGINISKDNQSTAPKSGGRPPDWCGI